MGNPSSWLGPASSVPGTRFCSSGAGQPGSLSSPKPFLPPHPYTTFSSRHCLCQGCSLCLKCCSHLPPHLVLYPSDLSPRSAFSRKPLLACWPGEALSCVGCFTGLCFCFPRGCHDFGWTSIDVTPRVSPWLGCERHRGVPLAYRSPPTPSRASNVWGMKAS